MCVKISYAIFGGDKHYPLGGWQDFKLFCANLEQVDWYLGECNFDWYQVYEFPIMKLIKEKL